MAEYQMVRHDVKNLRVKLATTARLVADPGTMPAAARQNLDRLTALGTFRRYWHEAHPEGRQ
jgi:hypothetical protein